MSNICEEYRQKLFELAQPQYKDFSSSLIPYSDNLLGVRLPEIRKLAKELAGQKWWEYFDLNEDVYFEETMLQGMTIGYLKENIETILAEVRRFVPKIDNWAVCDSFCVGLKITQKYKELMSGILIDYIKSDKPYYIRFAVVMMLNYYIDEEYIEAILRLFDEIRNENYYVKMSVAWAISQSYVKFPEQTMMFLQNNNLDDFTYNKSLQKICESFKLSNEEKAIIKSMKRRLTK